MANPADTTYSIIRETVEGTTPATPAFRNLDYIPGNEFKLDSKLLTSDVLKQNRAMAGLAKVNTAPLGDFKTHFRRDTALDLLPGRRFPAPSHRTSSRAALPTRSTLSKRR
jgi:hypothetical protein